MKKLLLLVLFGAFSVAASYGQELGVRFGDTVGGKVAIDGVFAFNGSRIHADVSFGDGVGIVGIYDFIVKPISIGAEDFNWYLGVGVSTLFDDPFELGIPGEIGLEYRFDFPLVIGADWRPTLIIIEETDFKFERFGLNVRWNFGG